MKKFFKHIATLSLLVLLLAPVASVKALTASDAWGGDGNRSSVQTSLGYADNNTDPRTIAANAIKVLLGFLGIIAVIIIIIAGFQWMNSGGDTKKVEESKTRLQNAVVGLIIIFSAWALSNFIFTQIVTVVGN
jgi:type IV secretory pathway VirB2 component (pilin)